MASAGKRVTLSPMKALAITFVLISAGIASSDVPKDVVQAGPFAWPPGGTSSLVLMHVTATETVSQVEWKLGADEGRIDLFRDAAGAVLRDVTHDGRPELVIFAKPPAVPPGSSDQSTVWIVGVGPDKRPARMLLLETQVIGATDEASLQRELSVATLGSTAHASPVKVIGRLSLATPAEMRALVGPKGLQLCKRDGDSHTCTTIAQKAIDKAAVAAIVKRGGVSRKFQPVDDIVTVPSCSHGDDAPTRWHCSATDGGNSGGEWKLDATGGKLVLVEVSRWEEFDRPVPPPIPRPRPVKP